VELESPNRHWSVATGFFAISIASAIYAQPVAISPRWQVAYPAAEHDAAGESTAVSIGSEATMVVVMAGGADVAAAKLLLGSRQIPLKVIGQDPISRLGFVKADGGVTPKVMEWVEDAADYAKATLRVDGPNGTSNARSVGWVKQVRGKVLPFALLEIQFSQAVPPPGTPLLNEAGRVVAIVFQKSGTGNTGYAIPAEAVHRVKHDVAKGGSLVRGWLGLALRAESPIPQISRVLPKSPAEDAGIKQNDVLVSIGNRQIADYADAADAFFYLIPGQPVGVKLMRGNDALYLTLTPGKPK
jgi:S1-C subfamily serine protease